MQNPLGNPLIHGAVSQTAQVPLFLQAIAPSLVVQQPLAFSRAFLGAVPENRLLIFFI
jgi:hypothetical protein